MTVNPDNSVPELTERARALPGVERLLRAAGDAPVYLVGGAVRDLLRGERPGDLDFVVEGEIGAIAEAIGGEIVEHERFATAGLIIDGCELDLASARAETYERPGALPEVSPATIEQDLARRDFTVNALALALSGKPRLLDPRGGAEDLREGVLRVLHDRSFVDDPTRALRAARYAARLGLRPDESTAELLAGADLSSVSEDRVVSELALIAAEPRPSAALMLVADWGLLELGTGPRLAAALERLFEADADWREFADRDTAILLAVAPGEHPARLRARAARICHHDEPGSAAEIQVLAHDHVPEVLAMARAAGAGWLDEYVKRLRHVELEIDGYDLIAAGAPEGPAIGRGLNAALQAKLDGEISSPEDELRVALAAAGGEADPGRT
jgi:tRNA nucleotidyltransferase (CCA-adding enzyme)